MKKKNINKNHIIALASLPLLLFFVVLFIISCLRPDIMVVNDDLIGKSVMLIRGDTIVPKQNNPQKTIRGRFFIYHTRTGMDTIFIPEEITIIGSHVVDHIKDGRFLLIDRKHLDSVFGRNVNWEENLGYVGRKDFPTDKRKQQEMLDASTNHVYYIINQQSADVYGPLSFDQYLTKKEEVGVPRDLKLKCER